MLLKNASVLIIDDDKDVLTAVRLLLKTEVKEVVTEKKPENIPSHLSSKQYDIILLDMNFNSSVNTGNEGFFWLKEIKKHKSAVPVIMITAYGDIDMAVRSLKEGAADFVVKPWRNERLIATISETLKKKNDKKPEPATFSGDTVIGNSLLGESEAMKDVFFKIEKIAPTDANILILGENGTGKDLIAKAIHQHSERASQPYVKVDVGALTETLFESELFGHQKGAFTDAREDRAGRFEAADHGTLFLDEIGNIPLHLQAKLLSVLQNRQLNRLGSNRVIPIDIRLICATNVSMQELANESRFRKDLIYRINTVEIVIPPLRTRGNDIMLLADHFCKVFRAKYMRMVEGFDSKAKDKLMQYSFPGNVRELQSVVERAVIMADDRLLKAEDLIFSPLENARPFEKPPTETNLNAVEKQTILKVVEKHNGNITRAARELGLTRTALYRRLSKHDI